jgi:hypothetical protein
MTAHEAHTMGANTAVVGEGMDLMGGTHRSVRVGARERATALMGDPTGQRERGRAGHVADRLVPPVSGRRCAHGRQAVLDWAKRL